VRSFRAARFRPALAPAVRTLTVDLAVLGVSGRADLPVIERLISGLRRVFSGEATRSHGSAADELHQTNLRQLTAIRGALVARNASASRHLMEDHIRDSWRLLQAVLDETTEP
jgi:DNA-binding GntR family transcriptional regulator